ncbi:MAG: IS1595 family transposase [Phycisphaerales bacterium]
MARKPRPELAKSATVDELPRACADEAEGVAFFERKRWGDSPACVHCGDVNVYQMKDRATGERNKRFLWRCRGCGKQYTVRTGTVFEESLIPMHKWARVFWEAAKCKNGVSALEISRTIGVSYKTALFMMHRVRWVMADDYSKPPKMTGIVEADETYIGGKPRYRGTLEKPLNKRGRGTKKQAVGAMVERGGSVRTRILPSVNSSNIQAMVRENVDQSARLMTDEFMSYNGLTEYAHERVNHRTREYARGDVTTNTVESFFARVKRGINGTYHNVSREHLHRYLAQFEFAHNTRKMNDGERVCHLIDRVEGKRLRYEA